MHRAGDEILDGNHGVVRFAVHDGAHSRIEGIAWQQRELPGNEQRGRPFTEGSGLTLKRYDWAHTNNFAAAHIAHKEVIDICRGRDIFAA